MKTAIATGALAVIFDSGWLYCREMDRGRDGCSEELQPDLLALEQRSKGTMRQTLPGGARQERYKAALRCRPGRAIVCAGCRGRGWPLGHCRFCSRPLERARSSGSRPGQAGSSAAWCSRNAGYALQVTLSPCAAAADRRRGRRLRRRASAVASTTRSGIVICSIRLSKLFYVQA